MAFAISLITAGLAALAVMALVTAKVFLIDIAGLTGLWARPLLPGVGLGLTPIGRGRLDERSAARPAPDEV